MFMVCYRWTRREQADFYRTVSSFGVVYDPDKKVFDWRQFRIFARLERKTDESLERYFWSFVSMCRTACRLPPRNDEGRDGLNADILDRFCYLNYISNFFFFL